MAKDIEKVVLNLEKVNLWGCDPESCDLVVGAMIKGVELGHRFPLGYVIKMGDNDYFLNRDANHRAHAHLRGKSLFICGIIGEYNIEENSKMHLLSDASLYKFSFYDGSSQKKLKRALEHLPLDVAKVFCKENDLNSKHYLSQ